MTENKTGAANRSRLITWADPMVAAAHTRTLSGLEYMQAILAGSIAAPPIAALMNMKLLEVEQGRVIFAVEPAEYHYNPMGTVHGGLAATLVDSAMACAIYSMAPPGITYTTIELHLNYIRPITSQTGRIRSIGEIIHVGRRLATAQARLLDDQDKLYGHATTTCLVIELKQE
jgi:uncharacterized protein (TIGR00369 family)